MISPAPGRARRRLGILARVIVTAVIAWYLVRGVRWSDVLDELHHLNLWLLGLVIALNACVMLIKAVRLRILLRPHTAPLSACFVALLTSTALNNVLPFRAGEVARLWMLERSAGIPKAKGIALAALEHLFEIVGVAFLSLAAARAVPRQRWAVFAAPIVVAVVVICMMILRRITLERPASGATRSGRVAALIEAVRRRFEGGVSVLGQPWVLAQASLVTLASWICETAMVLVCARSLGVTMAVPLAVVLLLGINLALAMPSTPANAGPFEGAAVVVLTLAGWSKPVALTFGLVYHFVQVIPVTTVGLTVAAAKHLIPSSRADASTK